MDRLKIEMDIPAGPNRLIQEKPGINTKKISRLIHSEVIKR